ncbi:MAG TPA: carboxypeptidase regulatory-like domain-containing protein [Candidatus Sulfotelmatobacter sp.]|nr:carboxypeptidase regulatory-like domain-containing protein [Candidatus Sulfotelmatobacter sp.]
MRTHRFGPGALAVTTASLLAFLPTPPAGAAASAPALVAQAAQTATITGTAKDGSGTPVAGAVVTASGPQTATATTDPTGDFVLVVKPGIYTIAVTRGGFQPVTLNDVAVTAGSSQPLSVTLSRVDLSSLRTIGRVSTSGRGASTINAGAAVSDYVPAQTFEDIASPQINTALQTQGDVTIEHLGSQQDTAIIVGGLQPYETQVLIDGHPVALGQYGVWLSHLFPSYLVGGIETQSGPGNTTPFANLAVGGTANILTPGFTQRTTAQVTTGLDNYNSQYTNVIATGAADRLQYVVAAGVAGINGPYFHKYGCAVSEDYGSVANSSASAGIVQFCGDESGSEFDKGQLLKLRYNFSPGTSFDVGFLGSYGGYSPQGTAWGNALGPTLIESCMYNSDPMICGNPAYANLTGKTINAIQWYPGTQITNTQQLYTAQFRTSIGNDTLLLRPYVGNIQPESYDGYDEGFYPSFYSPPNADAAAYTAVGGTCPPGTVFSYSQPTNSKGQTYTTPNGQIECFQYPYTFYEQDKLYGNTFSYIHPFGDDTLQFTYDFHGQSTFAYANAIGNVTVPLTGTRFSTLALTGDFHAVRNLTFDAGLYDTTWTLAGSQGVVDVATGAESLVNLQRAETRFDPHVAAIFRPGADDSFRLAWGTSHTFPFAGDVSGLPAYQPFAQSAPTYTAGIYTEKNPQLLPEFSSEFTGGVDHRFKNGAVLSADLEYAVVHDVFQQLEYSEVVSEFQGSATNPSNDVLGIFLPINVAELTAKIATVKYTYAPPVGWGYSVSVTADSSVFSGIPLNAYNLSPAFPVNNVQVCGTGLFTPGLATCIPYLKSFGSLGYTWSDGSVARLAVDYEGKNNPFYQPPFAELFLTLRHPINKSLEFQISVENLLNTNNFSNLPAPNIGEPLVAATSVGQTTYLPDLLPIPPRTVRAQLRLHTGR